MQKLYDRVSGGYSASRPAPPAELIDYLADLCIRRQLVWDCGTGNGQAAGGLAARFERVVATDLSANQIAEAVPHPKVEYRRAPDEASGLPAASVDLVAVAQALHWFDLGRFYDEVHRVARPRAVVAAWCYRLPRVDATIDGLVERLYVSPVLTPHWSAEVRAVEREYRDLPFPFREVAPPPFTKTVGGWDFRRFREYLTTWPAIASLPRREADVAGELDEIGRAWGEGQRAVRWRLSLRVGFTPGD